MGAMPKTKSQLDAEIAQGLAEFGKRAEVYWGDREIKVDDTAYRRAHGGAAPRGRGDWTFVIGTRRYQPGAARGAKGLPYAKAKGYAIAEAKRHGELSVILEP
jgi:hypothetical protein